MDLATQQLFDTIESGSLQGAEQALQNGADVNAKTEYSGKTSLHYAAQYGNIDVAKLLIDNGADVNAKTEYSGKTSLHYAAQYGNIDVAKLLIDNGADVNAKTERNGKTSLHCAAQYDNIDIAKLLIDNRAGVNAKTEHNGKTSLHYAAQYDNIDIAKLLIDNGADVNAKHRGGVTPLGYCDRGSEMERFIKAKIKEVNNRARIYFVATALTALIVTAAFWAQTYIILAALIIPAIIGLYGYSLYKEGKNIEPAFKFQENIEVTKSTVSGIKAKA